MERILVTVTGHIQDVSALARGLSLARRLRGTLFVLATSHGPGTRCPDGGTHIPNQEVEERLRLLVERARAENLAVEVYVAEGRFDEAVVRFCKEHRITLWIVGVPGKEDRGSGKRMVDIHKIRHRVGCPVEMVHPKRSSGTKVEG